MFEILRYDTNHSSKDKLMLQVPEVMIREKNMCMLCLQADTELPIDHIRRIVLEGPLAQYLTDTQISEYILLCEYDDIDPTTFSTHLLPFYKMYSESVITWKETGLFLTDDIYVEVGLEPADEQSMCILEAMYHCISAVSPDVRFVPRIRIARFHPGHHTLYRKENNKKKAQREKVSFSTHIEPVSLIPTMELY